MEVVFTFSLFAVDEREPERIEEFVNALDKICVQRIDYQTKLAFIEKMQSKPYGNLDFEPYSAQKEAELSERKNDLKWCTYTEFERVGGWFITQGARKDFCLIDLFLYAILFGFFIVGALLVVFALRYAAEKTGFLKKKNGKK